MRRFAFTPRWMVWHLLSATAVVTCLLLGDWQWLRAETTGSLQNLAYAVQWPVFAVFFAVMWWRMMRLESKKLDELEAQQAADQAGAEPVTERAVEAPTAQRAIAKNDYEDDPELAAYNRMLAELAAQDEKSARG